MTIFIGIYVTLLGLVLGSFYNVVGLRIPEGESIVRPPSQCPQCGTVLRHRDLIPIVSYLLSAARCRHCRARISLQYPLVEAATALLFLWVYIRFGLTGEGIMGFILVSLAVIITVTDCKFMLIPNKVLLFFLPLLFIMRLVCPLDTGWNHLLGAVVGGGVILLIMFLSRGGMGMGDVKLFILFGWVVGFPQVILAFIIACTLGSMVGGLLLLLGVIRRKQPIPFGPWLAIGTLVSYGYGQQIISGYLSLIR
ncbi:leader peptidase (prepilin peptidase)/N-methyltransferase [Paenibacillus sp. DS2015]|uniref:prepilin peptidase n=1 Tax=Paenibacillus sp. DS2015 TaxID=3373917 RepID=UPI003D1B5EFA